MKGLIKAAILLFINNAAAQSLEQSVGNAPSDPLRGHWMGTWQGQRNNGEMEMKLQATDTGRITGQMRATYAYPNNCSTSWENVDGIRKGDKFTARYDLGGQCGKVDVTFSIDQGRVMNGTWSNEYGTSGPFRLTKR